MAISGSGIWASGYTKTVAPGQSFGLVAPFYVAWSASSHRVTKLFPSGAESVTITNKSGQILAVMFNSNGTAADLAFAEAGYPQTASAGLELAGPGYVLIEDGVTLTFPASAADPIVRVDMKPLASATGRAHGCGIII
jgi:hypothetical protein